MKSSPAAAFVATNRQKVLGKAEIARGAIEPRKVDSYEKRRAINSRHAARSDGGHGRRGVSHSRNDLTPGSFGKEGNMETLTEKQSRFIDFFIETGNATEAARRAGYSRKTARAIGRENLTKPYIKKIIGERLDKLKDQRIATGREVLEVLTAIMRGEVMDQVTLPDGRTAETSPAATIRLRAAELLLRRYMAAPPESETGKARPQFPMSGMETLCRTEDGVVIIEGVAKTAPKNGERSGESPPLPENVRTRGKKTREEAP